MVSGRGRHWWRRNRWGLICLPVALLLTFGAASDRVDELWWNQDLRVQSDRAAPGEVAELAGVPVYEEVGDGDIEDYVDPPPTTVSVRLDRLEQLSAIPDTFEDKPLPDGTDGYRVHLTLDSAKPVLNECWVILVGDDGARYGDGFDPLSQFGLCSRLDEDGGTSSETSGEWTIQPAVLTAAGAEIDHLLLTWDEVHYVRLDLW